MKEGSLVRLDIDEVSSVKASTLTLLIMCLPAGALLQRAVQVAFPDFCPDLVESGEEENKIN